MHARMTLHVSRAESGLLLKIKDVPSC
jgi:hypothetical protein